MESELNQCTDVPNHSTPDLKGHGTNQGSISRPRCTAAPLIDNNAKEHSSLTSSTPSDIQKDREVYQGTDVPENTTPDLKWSRTNEERKRLFQGAAVTATEENSLDEHSLSERAERNGRATRRGEYRTPCVIRRTEKKDNKGRNNITLTPILTGVHHYVPLDDHSPARKDEAAKTGNRSYSEIIKSNKNASYRPQSIKKSFLAQPRLFRNIEKI